LPPVLSNDANCSVVTALSSSLDNIHRSSCPKISMEVLIMRLCSLKDFAGIDELIERLQVLMESHARMEAADSTSSLSGSQDQPMPAVHAQRHQAGASGAVQDGAAGGLAVMWKDFVETVKAKKPGLGGLLEACATVREERKGTLRISCLADMRGEMLCERENVSQLNRMAREFFRQDVKLSFEIDGIGMGVSSGGTRAARPDSLSRKKELIGSPLVQEILNSFQARISNIILYNKKT